LKGEGRNIYILVVAGLILIFSSAARASSHTMPGVELISPAPGAEVVAKRPEIVCRVDAFDTLEGVIVMFDGSDVTGVINATAKGFSFTPVEMLHPGIHSLTIIMTGPDGEPVQAEFSFSSRHSGPFEQACTSNNLSLDWEKTLDKPDEATFQNSYRMEANLAHESVIQEQSWDMRFTTNVRYLTQNLAVSDPLEKGINLANYLLSGSYRGETFQANTEIGDVSVLETQNTVNLSRRGGTFSLDYKDLKLKTFTVKSDEIFGFKDGLGIGGGSDDHIMGVSGEIGLFSDRLKLKTIYAGGGERGDAYSMYSAGGDKRGNVLGFLVSSNFFDNKLNTEAEIDFSHYDADNSDEFSYEDDSAWKLAVGGSWNAYSYNILYESFGEDYQVIGNPYIQTDQEGVQANFGASFPIHSVNVSLSRYNDNVDNDDLYAETVSSQGQIQYMFTKFEKLPIGLMYQYSEIESHDEPEYTFPLEKETEGISATVNYILGQWNFAFQAGFSNQDDKTPDNIDTDTVNYSLSSSYAAEHFSFSPSVSFNQSNYKPTGTRTESYVTSLDVRGDFWDQRITYECAGTFCRTEASDHNTKQDNYNLNFRVAYTLPEIWEISNPSAGFMGYYNNTEDYVYHTRTREFTLLFVFSASMPFIF